MRNAAAVLIPDEDAGALPALYVSLRSGSNVTEEELLRYVAKRILDPPARPPFIFVIAEIPLTRADKFAQVGMRHRASELCGRQALRALPGVGISCTATVAKTINFYWDAKIDSTTMHREAQIRSRFGRAAYAMPVQTSRTLHSEMADTGFTDI